MHPAGGEDKVCFVSVIRARPSNCPVCELALLCPTHRPTHPPTPRPTPAAVRVQFKEFKLLGLLPIKAPASAAGELAITYLDEVGGCKG